MYNILCLNSKGTPKIFFNRGWEVLKNTINNFKKCFVCVRPSPSIDLSQVRHSNTFRHGFALFTSYFHTTCFESFCMFVQQACVLLPVNFSNTARLNILILPHGVLGERSIRLLYLRLFSARTQYSGGSRRVVLQVIYNKLRGIISFRRAAASNLHQSSLTDTASRPRQCTLCCQPGGRCPLQFVTDRLRDYAFSRCCRYENFRDNRFVLRVKNVPKLMFMRIVKNEQVFIHIHTYTHTYAHPHTHIHTSVCVCVY